MYDEEPEYEEPQPEPEPPPGSTSAGTFTATVAREEIVRLVAERFFAQVSGYYNRDSGGMREAINDELRSLVQEAAKEHLDTLTQNAVESAVADLLTNGWTKTDGYGRETGRMTVKEVVLDGLTKSDSYNRETRAYQIAERILTEAIKKDLEPLIKQTQERIKAALNIKVDEALRTALLSAVGLRT